MKLHDYMIDFIVGDGDGYSNSNGEGWGDGFGYGDGYGSGYGLGLGRYDPSDFAVGNGNDKYPLHLNIKVDDANS